MGGQMSAHRRSVPERFTLSAEDKQNFLNKFAPSSSDKRQADASKNPQPTLPADIASSHASFQKATNADETDRLIGLHYLLKFALKGNFNAPVHALLKQGGQPHEPATVLEIGTGAGTWLMEMATDFPLSDFYGIDIGDMFPKSIKPSNTHFLHHDVFSGGTLPFENDQFDYVFMRQMLLSMSDKQLNPLLSDIVRVLKPGGYLEIVDVELKFQRPGPTTDLFLNKLLHVNFEALGVDLQLSKQLTTMLMTTQNEYGGFIDTRQHRYVIPVGWGGKFGDLQASNLQHYLEALDPKVTQARKSLTAEETKNGEPAVTWDRTAIPLILKECAEYQTHLNWFSTHACKAKLPASMPIRASHCPSPFPTSHGAPSFKGSTDSSQSHETLPPTPTISHHEWECIDTFVEGYLD